MTGFIKNWPARMSVLLGGIEALGLGAQHNWHGMFMAIGVVYWAGLQWDHWR